MFDYTIKLLIIIFQNIQAPPLEDIKFEVFLSGGEFQKAPAPVPNCEKKENIAPQDQQENRGNLDRKTVAAKNNSKASYKTPQDRALSLIQQNQQVVR